MRKQLVSVLGTAAAMLATGQASAGNLGAANEIFIGGATAIQRTFHLDIVTRFCDDTGSTPIRVFTEAIDDLPGGGVPTATTPALGVEDQVVVFCQFKSTFGNNLDGATVAVHKFNGGSATGVTPVSEPGAGAVSTREYLDPIIPNDEFIPAGTEPTTCARELSGLAPSNSASYPAGTPDDFWTSIDGTEFLLYECPTSLIAEQIPDGGISDVEPKIFRGSLASKFGVELPGVVQADPIDFVDRSNLQVKAGAGIVFGVAGTLQLFDALADAQFADGELPNCAGLGTRALRDSNECRPSLPRSIVSSIYTGEMDRWSDRAIYGNVLSTAGVTEGDRVNVCRRTSGSGTHAQTAVHFLNTNCADSTPAFVTFNNDPLIFLPGPAVYENAGSSDMDDCIDSLSDGSGFDGDWDVPNFPAGPPTVQPDDGGDSSIIPPGRTAFAIGYNSLERNVALSRDYRFFAIDRVNPTLEDAFNGDYEDIYYLSYQNRLATVAGGTDGDADIDVGEPDPALGDIRTTAVTQALLDVQEDFFAIWNSPTAAAVQVVNDGLIVDPDGIPANGDEWQGGFLQPSFTAPTVFSAGPTGTVPLTGYGRETAGGAADSCQALSLANP